MEKRHDWKVADRPGIPGDRWLCHEEVLGTGILRRGNAPAIDVEAEMLRLAERERKLREALAPVLAAFRERADAWVRMNGKDGHAAQMAPRITLTAEFDVEALRALLKEE